MAQNGNVGVASLLLSRSTEQLHVKDRQGRTALHLAARNGSLDVLMLLLTQGADITATDKVCTRSLVLLFDRTQYCSSRCSSVHSQLYSVFVDLSNRSKV